MNEAQRRASAREHRPKDLEAMRAAIHDLRARGFSDVAIAQACDVSIEFVRSLLCPTHQSL